MNIGVDVRTLAETYRTGVGELITELLSAVFCLDKTSQYYLFANGAKLDSNKLPAWDYPNVHWILTRYPNKLLNLSLLLLRRPRLDKLVAKRAGLPSLDVFFSPTLNFTSVSPTTKHLLFVHDLTFRFFPWFYTPRQRLWHRLLGPRAQCKCADLIFTPSENTKRDIVDYYQIPEEKIKVLYPGVPSVFKESEAINKELVKKKYRLPENFILFLGTIEPRKNILALIEAFEQFTINSPTSYPPDPSERFIRAGRTTPVVRAGQLPATAYHLVIAGAPGWKNQAIYQRAQASPLKDKVHFIRYVALEDKPALYALASLFVYPSFYEGFGFPVLEAMAAGTPVITSNRASLPEITGSAAYLVNPHRPEEVAAGMRQLLAHTHNPRNPPPAGGQICAICAQIKNGLAQAARFNWNTAAQTFLQLLPSH